MEDNGQWQYPAFVKDNSGGLTKLEYVATATLQGIFAGCPQGIAAEIAVEKTVTAAKMLLNKLHEDDGTPGVESI